MEENYGTIWVCQCCMLTHANGECCADDDHGGDGIAPWVNLTPPHTVTMGMVSEEHDCAVPLEEECDCDRNHYSTSQCDGCGSWLHGERHAFTLWGPAEQTA